MKVQEWLTQFVALITEEDFHVLVKQKEKLAIAYQEFSDVQKDGIFTLLKDMLRQDIKEYIYTLSIMLDIAKEERYMEEVFWALEQKQMDAYSWMQYDLCCHGVYKSYGQAKKLRERVVQAVQKELLTDIPCMIQEHREENRIVLMTEQLLSLKHSPTRVVFDMAYFLQEKLGYEVWIVCTPLVMQLGFDEWSGLFRISYVDYPKEFTLPYRDAIFQCMQLPIMRERREEMNALLKKVVTQIKPAFVYSIGMLNALADSLQSKIPVVAQTLDVAIPKSVAPMLIKIGNMYNDEIKAQMEYIAGKQTILENNVIYMECNVDTTMTREELGLPQNRFLIAVVGNRLDTELNQEETEFLKKLLDLPDVSLVFIGNYNRYMQCFAEEDKKGLTFAIGQQPNLMGVYDKLDLYVNPKRMGGGISAYMALQAGVPVVTLANCDVAFNVGEHFTVQNRQEMLERISSCVMNKDFFEKQREKALGTSGQSLEKATGEISNLIEQITKELKRRGWLCD